MNLEHRLVYIVEDNTVVMPASLPI
ncbi:MAG: hypothetical protein KF870_07985 [Leadbetterella sp.]|nr:hypothetical protein [Leadbetterella sp.]